MQIFAIRSVETERDGEKLVFGLHTYMKFEFVIAMRRKKRISFYDGFFSRIKKDFIIVKRIYIIFDLKLLTEPSDDVY